MGEPGNDVGVARESGVDASPAGRIGDSEVSLPRPSPDHATVALALVVVDLEDQVLAAFGRMMLPSAVP